MNKKKTPNKYELMQIFLLYSQKLKKCTSTSMKSKRNAFWSFYDLHYYLRIMFIKYIRTDKNEKGAMEEDEHKVKQISLWVLYFGYWVRDFAFCYTNGCE